jgi:hypothetical protein
MWDYSRYAMSFFRRYFLDNDLLPPDQLTSMSNSDRQISKAQGFCLSSDGYQPFVVYLPNGGTASIDLTTSTDQDTLRVWWYNPRTGGKLKSGAQLVGSAIASMGHPPEDAEQDWVALIVNNNSGNPDDGVSIKMAGAPVKSAPYAMQAYRTHDGRIKMGYGKRIFYESIEIIGINGKVVNAVNPGGGGVVTFRLKARGVYLARGKSSGKWSCFAWILWF